MNLTDFKKGDLVHHKTRPYLKMIVLDSENEDYIKCSWVTKRGNYHIGDFYPYELEHEEIEEPSFKNTVI